jgi:hypothetical protein
MNGRTSDTDSIAASWSAAASSRRYGRIEMFVSSGMTDYRKSRKFNASEALSQRFVTAAVQAENWTVLQPVSSVGKLGPTSMSLVRLNSLTSLYELPACSRYHMIADAKGVSLDRQRRI